jgi:hypothetical protein
MPGVVRRARHLAGLALRYGVGTIVDDPREFARLARDTATGRMRDRMTPWDDRDLAADDLGARMARRLRAAGRGTPALRDEVIGTITAWVAGRVGHDAATTRLTAIGDAVAPGDAASEWLFEASRLSASAGLFAASQPFLQRGYTQVLEEAERGAGYSARLRGVLVELHRRRLDAAVDRWTELLARRRPRGLGGAAVSALETLMSAITDPPVPGRPPADPPHDPWRASIEGRSIAVIGPAASRHLAGVHDLRAGVVNLARLGQRDSDLQHEEILYLNDETWKTHPRSETLTAVGEYEWLVLKSRTAEPPARSRVLTWGANLLFTAGKPNLVPLICFDLLAAGAGRLYLTGMDFYASPEPYAVDSVEHRPPLRDSARIASHNPIENRAFIANLLGSDRVTADPVVEQIVGLDDLDYLRRLDAHYGAPRR